MPLYSSWNERQECQNCPGTCFSALIWMTQNVLRQNLLKFHLTFDLIRGMIRTHGAETVPCKEMMESKKAQKSTFSHLVFYYWSLYFDLKLGKGRKKGPYLAKFWFTIPPPQMWEYPSMHKSFPKIIPHNSLHLQQLLRFSCPSECVATRTVSTFHKMWLFHCLTLTVNILEHNICFSLLIQSNRKKKLLKGLLTAGQSHKMIVHLFQRMDLVCGWQGVQICIIENVCRNNACEVNSSLSAL